ncbi:MAG: MBL fold metallo-hydrolase, partial [Oscillospiraceae bacterium]|nr:MBL fold metallo-hydrolase [Oscillospiraceae bacterium]
MEVKIRYLYHSGFAVQTPKHFLIFDYWKQRPKGKGLESGVVDPSALSGQDVIVFASHNHGDH